MPDHFDCAVVMLAHNGAEFTAYCLHSMLQAETLPRQLILIDNASTDRTPAVIADHADAFARAGIELITWRNDENLGCSLARNQGWERATTRYVLFMDNDTAVCTRNWLAPLTAAMAADPRLGVLGPKLIYPYRPHPIQCAGVGMNTLGRIRFRGRGCARDDGRFARRVRVPLLISACWIMPNELYHTVGGLDELFHPVQYEDLDFCMRVNQAGLHCAYTPEVEMYHFEGKTTASFGRETYQRNIAVQSAKFRRRWIHAIRALGDGCGHSRWLPDDELGLAPGLDLDLELQPPSAAADSPDSSGSPA